MTIRNCPNCREETAHFNGTCAKCNGKPKDYCCECHISFGLAEKRYAIDQKGVAHKDCYEKHLLKERMPIPSLVRKGRTQPYAIH